MDPIYQTLLTLACMLATYFWGKYKGASAIGDEIIELLGCKEIHVLDDGRVYFIDKHGNRRTPEEAFK